MISRSGAGDVHGFAEDVEQRLARPEFLDVYHAPRRSGRSMSARTEPNSALGVTATLAYAFLSRSSSFGILRRTRRADEMRPWRAMSSQ